MWTGGSGCAGCSGEPAPQVVQRFGREPIGRGADGDGGDDLEVAVDNGGGDEARAGLALLIIDGIAALADTIQVGIECLRVDDCVGRETLEDTHDAAPVFRRRKGQEALAGGGGMKRAALAEAGSNFDAVLALEAVDDDDVRAVEKQELNGLFGLAGDAAHELAHERGDVLARQREAAELLHGGTKAVEAFGVSDEETPPLERPDEAKRRSAMNGQKRGELGETQRRRITEGGEECKAAIQRLHSYRRRP